MIQKDTCGFINFTKVMLLITGEFGVVIFSLDKRTDSF